MWKLIQFNKYSNISYMTFLNLKFLLLSINIINLMKGGVILLKAAAFKMYLHSLDSVFPEKH